MRTLTTLALSALLFIGSPVAAQSDTANDDSLSETSFMDSLEARFTYLRGVVELPEGGATLRIPEGFKFLDQEQAQLVLTELWGNPSAHGVLGMLLPEADGVMADSSYAFVVQFDPIGYVKDKDADKIDYSELLEEMRSGEEEENRERMEAGYEPAYLIGWAQAPFYDKERKVLHWAKELRFGDDAEVNTLNYNVRVLGRKGVLVLNAVADMPQLPLVRAHIADVLDIVEFKDGYRYDQFDSKVDEVAAWTIGGLVAGKVLAKAGILALLLKNLKLVLLAVAGLGGLLWRVFTGRKKDKGPEGGEQA